MKILSTERVKLTIGTSVFFEMLNVINPALLWIRKFAGSQVFILDKHNKYTFPVAGKIL